MRGEPASGIERWQPRVCVTWRQFPEEADHGSEMFHADLVRPGNQAVMSQPQDGLRRSFLVGVFAAVTFFIGSLEPPVDAV